jgi:coproporphyrinogen III oxidase-like Fe-S oxidoreductase
VGPSAHSFQAGSRWWNVRSIKKYCQLFAAGKPRVEACEALSEEQIDLESLALGFRSSDGIGLHAAGGGLRWGKVLEELQRMDLVKVNNGRIQPTRKGLIVADSLPLMFDR